MCHSRILCLFLLLSGAALRPVAAQPVSLGRVLAGTVLPNGFVSDAQGNWIVATESGYPPDQCQVRFRVYKLAPDGTALWTVEPTAAFNAYPQAIALAPNGDIYVAVRTVCRPAQPEADRLTPIAGVLRLDSRTGRTLAYQAVNPQNTLPHTLFPLALAVALNGDVWMSGTASPGNPLPRTPGTPELGMPYFLAQFPATLDRVLRTGTGLGGRAIAFGPQGDLYLAGDTFADRPTITTTPGAFQRTVPNSTCGAGGVFEALCAHQYIARLNANATGVRYATYLTGEQGAVPGGLAVNAEGTAVVVGSTYSTDYPVTDTAIQRTNRAQYRDPDGPTFITPPPATGYVSRLSPDGAALVSSTYLGGSVRDAIRSIQIRPDGRLFVTGETYSPDFPLLPALPPACQPSLTRAAQNARAFAATLSRDGSRLDELRLVNTRYASGFAIQRLGDEVRAVLTSPDQYSTLAVADIRAEARPDALACVTDGANGMQTDVLAPGRLLVLNGFGIGPAATMTATPVDGRYPVELAGFQIRVNGVPAPLLYISPNQVNFVVPFEASGSVEATLQITRPGGEITRRYPVVERYPTVFTVAGTDATRCDQVLGLPLPPQVLAINPDGQLNACGTAFDTNGAVTVFLNGAGIGAARQVTGAVNPDQPLPFGLPIAGPQASPWFSFAWRVQDVTALPGSIAGLWRVQLRLTPGSSGALPVLLQVVSTPTVSPSLQPPVFYAQ